MYRFLAGIHNSSERNQTNTEVGAALVELAIVISLLILLAFGIVNFGMAIYDYNRMVEVVKSAARATSRSIIDETTPPIYPAPYDRPMPTLTCNSPDADIFEYARNWIWNNQTAFGIDAANYAQPTVSIDQINPGDAPTLPRFRSLKIQLTRNSLVPGIPLITAEATLRIKRECGYL